MIKHIAKPLIATALLSCAQFANATLLSTLIDDAETIVVGNGIVFSNFTSYSGNLNANLIEVTQSASGNGLTFTADPVDAFTLTDDQGGNVSPATDFLNLFFGYQANAASGNTITGQSMIADFNHTKQSNAELNGYSLVSKEIFDDLFGTNSLGEINFIKGNEALALSDWGVTPTGSSATAMGTTLFVDDYLEVNIGEGETASITSWTQNFTQRENQVPAPATLALFALGLLGMGASRRKA